MSTIVDQVISIKESTSPLLHEFAAVIRNQSDHTNRVKACEEFLQKALQTLTRETFPTELIDTIISKNGKITIAELCMHSNIHERTLERLFKKFIGVSPKFYSRIIRFSYIFSVVNNKTLSWSEIGLESGYYDQPHFIKNFKSFTGEEPARYFFEEETLANFFLKKTVP
jgi:methylphosphotriester-DNA--protein-cysteine methyltransferase